MTIRLWVLATIVVAAAGIGAFIGQRYIAPFPALHVEFKENSCAIRCPATTPYAASPGSVSCAAGVAPLCQCTDAQKPGDLRTYQLSRQTANA
jgi:hypothetical protein